MRRLTLALLLLSLVVACDHKTSAPPVKPAAPATAPAADPAPLTSPADVVAAYYTASWDMELEKAYQLVSSGDRAAKPLDEFQRSVAAANEKFADAKRSFAVHDTKLDGDTARVSVDITAPDVSRIHQAVMNDFASRKEIPDPAKLGPEIERRIADPEAPRTTKRHEVTLVQEDGMWRLDFDWDGERPDRAMPERVKPPTE